MSCVEAMYEIPMSTIYESPDRGKTIYARPMNDYVHRWEVKAPRHDWWATRPALTDAAEKFSRIETTQGASARERVVRTD